MAQENLRVRITKKMIRDALLALLEQKPLPQVTITELCAQSGVNRATFYRHYRTPQEVLLEIEREFVQQMEPLVVLPRDRQETEAAILRVCEYMYQRAPLLRQFVVNQSDEDVRLFIEELTKLFWGGAMGAALRRQMDEDAMQVLITYTVGGAYALMRQSLLGHIRKTPQELAAILISAFDSPLVLPLRAAK